jgi:hypothetical protein
MPGWQANVADDVGDACGIPQRRCAAAEIDRDPVARKVDAPAVVLGENRIAISPVRRLADLDREVTVRAQLAAPGKMDVDA